MSNNHDLQEGRRRLGIKTMAEVMAEWTGEPWPKADVTGKQPRLIDVQGLREVIEAAEDEAPIQKYLTEHPVLLSVLGGGGHGRWVIPKLRLAEVHVTDFAVADLYSSGYQWFLVELESPRARVLTRVGGEPSKEFRHAKQQIDDWRIWLRDNVAYVQRQQKYEDLDDTFTGVIIIGRREEIPKGEMSRKRYRELSTPRLQIMSYGRFLQWVSDKAARTQGT